MDNLWEKFKTENKDNLKEAADKAKEALGDDAEVYAQMLNNTDKLQSMFSMLSSQDMEKLNAVINNPELIKKILASPKARENLKKILSK